MILNGFIIGALTLLGLVLLFIKLPEKMKKILLKFPLILDIVLSIGVYFISPGAVTAFVAASIFGILFSILTYYYHGQEHIKE